jgi:ribosomal protein L37AE/L43A
MRGPHNNPEFLETIYGDICGPISPPSGPFYYFMVIRDGSGKLSDVSLLTTRGMDTITVVDEVEITKNTFKCEFCPREFNTRKQETTHEWLCKKNPAYRERLNERNSRRKQKISCPECDKVLTVATLRGHLKKHK